MNRFNDFYVSKRRLIDESIYIEARRKLDEQMGDSYEHITTRLPHFINVDELIARQPEPPTMTTWNKHNPDILPCPFCGCATCFAVVENPRDTNGLLMYTQCFVGCIVCKITTAHKDYDYRTRDMLIEQWNKRITDEEVS